MAKDAIYIDTRQIERLALELKGFEKQVGQATFSAIKRTLDHVRTHGPRIVSKEYSLKVGFVKGFFKNRTMVNETSNKSMSMDILIVGRTLTLARFPHSPNSSTRRKYKVKVSVKRGARKEIKTDPKPFIASTGALRADKIQSNIFRRLGPSRLPIAPVFTLSVPQMVTNEKVANQIQEVAGKKLAERLEHEITYRMLKSFKTSR